MVFLERLCRDCTQRVKICTKQQCRGGTSRFLGRSVCASILFTSSVVCSFPALSDLQAPLKTFNKRNGNN